MVGNSGNNTYYPALSSLVSRVRVRVRVRVKVKVRGYGLE
jgi:hypothetical protein